MHYSLGKHGREWKGPHPLDGLKWKSCFDGLAKQSHNRAGEQPASHRDPCRGNILPASQGRRS